MTDTLAEIRSPRISLVLGSGGARGYAHIGVIDVLRERGFEIRSISGASMGALVGGIHAAGKLEDYKHWVCALQKMHVLKLIDWTFSGGGFIKGDRIIGALRELIGDREIESLPVSFTAVTTDIDAMREVWLTHGPLFDAIRASIAIPSLLRPHYYEGRTLVDGGLLNPVPITPTLRDLTDATIAVSLNGPVAPLPAPPVEIKTGNGGYRQKITEFLEAMRSSKPEVVPEPKWRDLVARSIEAMQETITRLKLAAHEPDLLIEIPRNACAFYEFYRAQELIELGRTRTEQALANWQCPVPRRPYKPGMPLLR